MLSSRQGRGCWGRAGKQNLCRLLPWRGGCCPIWGKPAPLILVPPHIQSLPPFLQKCRARVKTHVHSPCSSIEHPVLCDPR